MSKLFNSTLLNSTVSLLKNFTETYLGNLTAISLSNASNMLGNITHPALNNFTSTIPNDTNIILPNNISNIVGNITNIALGNSTDIIPTIPVNITNILPDNLLNNTIPAIPTLNIGNISLNVEAKGSINDDAFKSVMMITNIIIAIYCVLTIVINNKLHIKMREAKDASIDGMKKGFSGCVEYAKSWYEQQQQHSENAQQSSLSTNVLDSGQQTPNLYNSNYDAEATLTGASAKIVEL